MYDDAKVSTSDDELYKKIVIKNYANLKDEKPNVIDIDNETGKVRQISHGHDSIDFKSVLLKGKYTFNSTFLPNGYPESVTDNYLRFTWISCIGSMTFMTMGFLTT